MVTRQLQGRSAQLDKHFIVLCGQLINAQIWWVYRFEIIKQTLRDVVLLQPSTVETDCTSPEDITACQKQHHGLR